jgi:hypothetical protein
MLTAKYGNDAASHLDALLDEALEETFPASDPIAISFRAARKGWSAAQARKLRGALHAAVASEFTP